MKFKKHRTHPMLSNHLELYVLFVDSAVVLRLGDIPSIGVVTDPSIILFISQGEDITEEEFRDEFVKVFAAIRFPLMRNGFLESMTIKPIRK